MKINYSKIFEVHKLNKKNIKLEVETFFNARYAENHAFTTPQQVTFSSLRSNLYFVLCT